MNSAEVGVTLLSFIYALALTHVLQCLRDLWIARDRVKRSASMLIWMVAVLAFAVLSWIPSATGTDNSSLGPVFALLLAYSIGVYFVCALASPHVPEEGVVDLTAYEDRNGAGFKLLIAALMVIAVPLNYVLDHGDRMPIARFLVGNWFVLAVATMALVGWWRRETVVRIACASGMLGLSLFVLAGNLGLRG